MPCDTYTRRNQTLTQRKDEIKKVTDKTAAGLVNGKVVVKVGRNGAVTFTGIPDDERAGITDGCIYRRIMVSGSALAKQKIVAAELRAGVTVNKQMVAQGVHSHDGGRTWHDGH